MRLEEYVSEFQEFNRDAVVAQILKSRMIKQAFETEAGTAIFNSTVDEISKKIMSILGACTESTKKSQLEMIAKLSTEVHVMYHLLKTWAEIMVAGQKHQDEMDKS